MSSDKASDIEQRIRDTTKMCKDLLSKLEKIDGDQTGNKITGHKERTNNNIITGGNDKVVVATGIKLSKAAARWKALQAMFMSARTIKRGSSNKKKGSTDDNNNSAPSAAADNAEDGTDGSPSIKEVCKQIQMLCTNLDHMKFSLTRLKELEEQIGKTIKTHSFSIKDIHDAMITSNGSTMSLSKRKFLHIHEMNIDIAKLKFQIPSSQSASSSIRSTSLDTEYFEMICSIIESCGGLNLYASKHFHESSIFFEIESIYKGLDETKQKCLSCFVVFPENIVIKKKIITYLWYGESILEDPGETIDEILNEFVKTGLIEPSYKKRERVGRVAKRFRMSMLVRSTLLRLAGAETFFLNYKDDYSKQKSIINPSNTSSSVCKRACLLKSEDPEGNDLKLYKESLKKIEWGNLKTLFNVDETFPDLTLKWLSKNLGGGNVAEWLGKMKSLQVLNLGRWQTSVKNHIKVGSTEFFTALNNMPNLRLLSLEGVSNVVKISKNSFTALGNLRILNLKACHNLEELPKGISSLKKLTHLDLSCCYLIENMPRELSLLTQLQILKGFVVSDVSESEKTRFCSLEGLEGMKSLRKLSITIGRKEFPTEVDLTALKMLHNLQKLTLSWGAIMRRNTDESSMKKNKSNKKSSKSRSGDPLPPQLPGKLEKLDIQCFPETGIPSWLTPDKLSSLKKLYIRGGRLGDLKSKETWASVETLRLKFLWALKMTWEELQELFPKLNYLEKVDCPLITMCPCDEDGVWVR